MELAIKYNSFYFAFKSNSRGSLLLVPENEKLNVSQMKFVLVLGVDLLRGYKVGLNIYHDKDKKTIIIQNYGYCTLLATYQEKTIEILSD